MRTEESSKNAITTLIFYVLNSIFNFISKTVFINFLGIEYSGLNSLYTNILGVLNITELGLNTTVGYSLYKPLATNDTKTINEILKLYKSLYRIIALIIMILGLCITFILPYMVNTTIDLKQVRIFFVLYLSSTVISYLFTFLNVLPIANQKNYLVTKIQGILKIVKNIIQLIVIVMFKNYYIWLGVEIFGNIFSYIYTNFVIKKKYAFYEDLKDTRFIELLKKYKEVVLKAGNLFFHKIGALVVYQTDNIVISYFCTLAEVGIYGNYMLVFSLISGIFEQVFSGITASIGNLIIQKGKKETYKIWKELHILTVFLTTICCYLFYKLINKFITVWVGQEYILSNVIVFAITFNIMFKIIKQPIDKFKDAFGIFWDKLAPITEAIINLIISVILAKEIGILGVVIGTIISNIIITAIWKPYVVFKHGFKEKIIEYIKLNIPLLILSVISIVLTNILINVIQLNMPDTWLGFIMAGITYGIITLVITIICFMSYKTFRQILIKYINIFKNMILKILIKK